MWELMSSCEQDRSRDAWLFPSFAEEFLRMLLCWYFGFEVPSLPPFGPLSTVIEQEPKFSKMPLSLFILIKLLYMSPGPEGP